MRIIHIGPDSQFVQFVGGVFESVAPKSNEYIILSSGQILKNPLAHGFTQILRPDKFSLLKLPLMVRQADAVIAHGMSIHSILAFLSAPSRSVKIWSGWGFDYYGLNASTEEGLLGERTLTLVHQLRSGSKIKNWRRKLLVPLISFARSAAVRKVDLFSAPIPDDYEVMRQAFPGFSGDYVQINYGDVQSTFSAGADVDSGKNILVGNSASATNNHLEIFDILSGKDLADRKVVVPLSYGDAAYRGAVINYGRRMLGEAFHPLVDFIPMQDYVGIVASCGIVIMNHRRQQALGNIGSALYHGSRVYLDEKNPVYNFFNQRNATVYSVRSLKGGNLPLENISGNEIRANRDALESFWGRDTVAKNVAALVDRIKSSRCH